MKRTNYIYIFLALVVTVSGCKDAFLEEKKDYAGYNEEVFKDPFLAQGYVDFVYGMFLPANNAQSLSWNLATNNDNFAKTTDEFAGETDFNKEWAQISYTNAHALNYFGARLSASVPNNPYTRLKQINIFLEQVDKYGLPEDTRNKLKGQLYFWRAWQYFDLIRLYGGVPLVLVAQDPVLSGGTELQVPRSSTSDCIIQIVKDLDIAMNLLPGKWTGSGDWGRITSGAAAALKGRVLLTWASPLFNRNDDKGRWEDAYKANLAAKTLLEQNGSALFKAGGTANGTAWGDMWFQEVGNPEAVIVYGFNNLAIGGTTTKNNGWEQAARSREINGGGSLSPTKQIVDAFPMKDGKMPGASSTYVYDAAKFYKNRDPRFYKTFVYNGAIWPYAGGSNSTNYKQWTYKWYKTATETTPSLTTETKGANASGIYLCKATSATANGVTNGNFSQSGTDFMEMRFAEVVLNLAESAIGSDRLAEGLDGIKLIRERAGVENLDGSYGLGAIAGRDALFAAVLNERKIEFAYEGKRFFDLRRWMLFEAGPTSARLGIAPLNGTRRTGYFITVKTTTGTKYVGTPDPLLKVSANAPVIDRDPLTYPPGITTYAQYLDYLYDNYFTITVKDDLDKTNPANWKFTWYPQYYFFGLNENILSSSPGLQQTIGWNSLQGAGTFDPLK